MNPGVASGLIDAALRLVCFGMFVTVIVVAVRNIKKKRRP